MTKEEKKLVEDLEFRIRVITRKALKAQNYSEHYNMREGKDYKIQSSTVEIPNKFIRTSRSTVSADIPLESVPTFNV